MNFGWRRHPSYKDLLLASDGDLPAPRLQEIHAHLRRCPRCQNALDDIDGTMTLYRESSLAAPPEDEPSETWRAFRKRLAGEARTLRVTTPVAASPWTRAIAAVSLVVGLIVAVEYSPTVRATELLERAVATERASATTPVDRLDIAFSPTPDAPHRDLAGVLQEAGLTKEQLFTASAFAAWRRRVHASQETLQEAQGLITITTRAADGPVREGRIVLHRDKLTTQRVTWVLANNATVDVARAEGRDPSAPASTPKAEPAPVNAAAASSLVDPATSSISSSAPPVNLDIVELSVRDRLHDIGADLDAELTIARTPRAILVEGLAANRQQRERIEASLSSIEHVNLRVRAASDVDASSLLSAIAAASAKSPGSASVKSSSSAKLSSSRSAPLRWRAVLPPLAESWLERRYTNVTEREQYSSRAVNLGAAVRRRGLALERLVTRYDDMRMKRLDAESRQSAERLIGRHADSLLASLAELEAHLAVLSNGRQPEPSACAAPDGTRANGRNVGSHTGLVDDLTVELFSAHSPSPDLPATESPERALSALSCAVRDLRGALNTGR